MCIRDRDNNLTKISCDHCVYSRNMNFSIVQREDLKVQKWDDLVSRTEGVAVFSSSFYLDAVAENWCVLVNDDYTAGVALPYTVRARRKILYTPIFVSYLEVLGDVSLDENVSRLIQKQFKTIEIELDKALFGDPQEVFVTQFLNPSLKRKGQVNRMLNKSKRAELEVTLVNNWTKVFDVMKSELLGKFSGMTEASLQRLKKAYGAAEQLDLIKTFEIQKGNQCVGGIICIEKNGQLLYSKGACLQEAREQGGMYAAIDAAIMYAQEKNLSFDFGGSRVEGVRRFNVAFGGEDTEYYSYRIDRSPRWFRWVRRMKKRWGKKS